MTGENGNENEAAAAKINWHGNIKRNGISVMALKIINSMASAKCGSAVMPA
jgi:hypothetical protein